MNSPRIYYLFLFLACVSLLSYGYYLEFVDGLEPCPLCIFQRLAYMAIIVISLIACIHAPVNYWSLIYNGSIIMSALIGAGIAGRQVWLQHLPPDKVPECGPSLDYMLEAFPLTETLKIVFTGSGECAEVDWTFLSLSIAEWSLICFTGITLLSIIYSLRKKI